MLSDYTGSGPSVLPDDEAIPRMLFRSVESARAVALKWMATFASHRLALYGEAYPYEGTSLSQEVAQKGAGVVGWIQDESDDEDGPSESFTVYVVALQSDV